MKIITSFLVLTLATPALAQSVSKINIDYSLSFLGLPIGSIIINSNISGNEYKTSSKAKSGGVGKLFSGGWANIETSGTIGASRMHGKMFSIESKGKEEVEKMTLELSNDNFVRVTKSNPKDPHPASVPLTDEHKRNVTDPSAATVIIVPGIEPVLSPNSCNKVSRVFTGTYRFDVTTSYVGTEKASLQGYSGDVLKCRVTYKAVAGHRTDKNEAKENEKVPVFAWFMPVGKTRMLVPYKIEVQHKFGRGYLTADRLEIK